MRIIYFLTLFCCSQFLFAQQFNSLVNTKPNFVAEFDLPALRENQLAIAMPFAKKIILNPAQKKQITEKVIIKLELIYTEYRTSSSFNQKQLNKNRLKELSLLIPSLFENRFWKYNLISQTKGSSQPLALFRYIVYACH